MVRDCHGGSSLCSEFQLTAMTKGNLRDCFVATLLAMTKKECLAMTTSRRCEALRGTKQTAEAISSKICSYIKYLERLRKTKTNAEFLANLGKEA